jgi:beta-glucosidase
MLASFSLNTYRFSVEWSRIEPVEGAFSQAELGHYRRMLEVCHQHGVTPVVTYSHVALPAWFAFEGAWESPNAVARFARYCSVVTKALGDLITYALTINEPNLPMLFRWLEIPHVGTLSDLTRSQLPNIRKQANQPRLTTIFLGDPDKMLETMLAAHSEGRNAIKAERSSLPVGFSLAIEDDQAPTPEMQQESHVAEKHQQVYAPWFNIAKSDDYIGVQNYTRTFVGKTNLTPPADAELTQSGFEFYPEGLEHCIRLAARETGVPVLVTENGIAIADDARRVAFIRRAVAGLERCRKDGIDVRGYIHWSLLDNFEWVSGYGPTFGLVAVDRTTQKRTPKPSAHFLGTLARNSGS